MHHLPPITFPVLVTIRNTYSADTYCAPMIVWYDTVDYEKYLHFKLVHITY